MPLAIRCCGDEALCLAKLGYHVDTVETSAVACEKIKRFARAERVHVRVRNEPVETADLAEADYGLVLMNGSLHYIRDKQHVLHRVLIAARGWNRTEDR